MTTANELTCQELIELVTEYLEGTLSPTERARFDAHLGTCAGCRTWLEQMRRTIRTLGKLTEESIPPESKQELLQLFRNWKKVS
ncbi:MAG: zf-HC2 domain-containing protein [Chloroflexi bacterium]|nr:zf-HC2 domain-containing protein [Chloroflexota bacterium]